MNYHTRPSSPAAEPELTRADVARAALRSLAGPSTHAPLPWHQQHHHQQQQHHLPSVPHLPHPHSLPAAPAEADGSYFGGALVGTSPTSSPLLAPANTSTNGHITGHNGIGIARRASQRQGGRSSTTRPPSSSSWCDTPGSQTSHMSNQSHASYLSTASAAPSLSLSLGSNNGSGSLHGSFAPEVPLCTPPQSAAYLGMGNPPGQPAAALPSVPSRSEATFQRVANRLQLDVADVKAAVLQQDARREAVGSGHPATQAVHHRLDRDTLRLVLEMTRAEDERLSKLASFRTEYLRAESLRMQVELEQHRQAHARDHHHQTMHSYPATPASPPPAYEVADSRPGLYARHAPPALPSRAHRSMDDYTTTTPLHTSLQPEPQAGAFNNGPRHSLPFRTAGPSHSDRILAPLPHHAPPTLTRRRDTSASLPYELFGNPFASTPRSPDLHFHSPSTRAESIASESRRGSVDSNMSGVGSKRRHDVSEDLPAHEDRGEWSRTHAGSDALAAAVAARLAPPRTSSLADATARMDIRDAGSQIPSRRPRGSTSHGKASRPSSSESIANPGAAHLDHDEIMARLRNKVAARLAAKQQQDAGLAGLGLVEGLPQQAPRTASNARRGRGRTSRPESAGNASRQQSGDRGGSSRPRKVVSMSQLQRCDEAPSRSPSDEEHQQTPIATKQAGRPFDEPEGGASRGIEALLSAAAIRETPADASAAIRPTEESSTAPLSESGMPAPSLRAAA